MNARQFKGFNDVLETMAKIKLQKVNESALKCLSNSQNKNDFLFHLTNAEAGDSGSLEKLKIICGCISEITMEAISNIGIVDINSSKLVEIAFGEKASLFRSAINAAMSTKGQERDIAVNQIYGFLGVNGATSGYNNDTPNTQNKSQSGASSDGRNASNSNNTSSNVAHMDSYKSSEDSINEGEEGHKDDAKYGAVIRIYGGKCACCFNQTENKANLKVITVDFARGENKVYDWGKKVIFQFTQNEMVYLYGVLMGYINKWSSNMHEAPGAQKISKNFNIERQDKAFFASLRISNEETGRAVPIGYDNSAMLAGFVFKRIKAEFEGISDELIHSWVKSQCATYKPVERAAKVA